MFGKPLPAPIMKPDGMPPKSKGLFDGFLPRFQQQMGQIAPIDFGEDDPIPIMQQPAPPVMGMGGRHYNEMMAPAAGNPAVRFGETARSPHERMFRGRGFAGFMARGGRMMPGQWAVVGEDGPEIARANPDGTTEVMPMNDPPVQTLGGLQETPGPVTDPYMGGPDAASNPSDPQLQQQISQLGQIGDAAKAGIMFRDPSRFTNIQPSGLGAVTPEQQDAGGASSNPNAPVEQPFDPNAPAPMAPGRYGDSIPEMQRQGRDLEKQIELTGKGKDGGPREKSLWRRLGKGIVNGYKNWDGQGGLMGLAVSSLGGGVSSAASPQAHQVGELKNQRGQLFRKLGTAYQMQEQDTKNLYQQSQIMDNASQINYRNSQATTAAQKQRAEANEAKVVQRNGKVYRQYADGREVLAPEITSTQVERSLPDGTKGWVDFKEALESADRQMLAQAQMDMQAGRMNADSYEAYEKQMIDHAKAVNDRSQKEANLIAEANEAFNLSNDATLLPSERNEHRAKYQRKMEEANNLPQPPKPKLPRGDFKAPTIGAKTVSQAELQAIATRTGKKIEEVKVMAERDGYTIR